MTRKRHYFLDETYAAKEINKMMCRVVVDKLLPLHQYAPAEPLSPNQPSHNVQDILPDILPEPFIYENFKQFLQTTNEGSVRAGLSSILELDMSSSKWDSLSMDSEMVKRYTLNDPGKAFNALMENEHYARDVRELLKDTSFGRAYLVVGFLTTTGTKWKLSESRSVSAGVQVTLPVQSPLPGIGDPQLHPSFSTTSRQGQHQHVIKEEIFAVAYNKIKISYSLDRSTRKLKKTPVLGRAIRPAGRQFAFRGESDSSDSSDDEDGTKDAGERDDSHTMEVVMVDEDDYEADGLSGRSNYFDCDIREVRDDGEGRKEGNVRRQF
jgi:hypothetical protein